jgi:hypothetical protein
MYVKGPNNNHYDFMNTERPWADTIVQGEKRRRILDWGKRTGVRKMPRKSYKHEQIKTKEKKKKNKVEEEIVFFFI